MVTYKNRINNSCIPCKGTSGSSSGTTNTGSTTGSTNTGSTGTSNTGSSTIKTDVTINNVKCGTQKILNITLIKDKVVIMFNDCSYITADKSVIDENFCSELAEQTNQALEALTTQLTQLQEQVNTLGSKEDKDTIYDDAEIKEKVSAIEEKLGNLVDVQDFAGKTSFKAFPA